MLFKRLKENWKSGLTVSLVSIPLSVSLAVASQASPLDGIITAVWAGLVASYFGGSNYNIVGPTGALSGILATYAIGHGADTLSVLAVISGIIILCAFLLKLERYLVFVPASALHGFTLGVAFIIAFNQFNFATGLTGLTKHEKFIDNLVESFKHVGATSPAALSVFLIFLMGLFLILKYLPRIPAVIALTPFGVIFGYLTTIGKIALPLQTLQTKFGDIPSALFQARSFHFDTSIILPAFTVALIAILETMLSAKIADGMTHTKHDKRKEMFGLGVANIASGFMGGIPATAALARTSLNIKSGANDKISATISSVCVALISVILISTFKYIPLAVIAAILVFTAYRMIEMHHFVKLYRLDRKEFYLSLIVAFITVYEDPIIGILFGVAAALIIFMDTLSRGQYELTMNDLKKGKVAHVTDEEKVHVKEGVHTLVYSIRGQLAYMNAQAHVGRFEHGLSGYEQVVLRLRELYFMDLDGVEAIDEIIELVQGQHKKIYITGVNPLIEKLLFESKYFAKLKSQGHVFQKTSQVLTKLGFPLQS